MLSSRIKRNLAHGVRFMEMDTTLNVQLSLSKLPDRAVQLLNLKASRRYGIEEVIPRDQARSRCYFGIEEQSTEHLERFGINSKFGLGGFSRQGRLLGSGRLCRITLGLDLGL